MFKQALDLNEIKQKLNQIIEQQQQIILQQAQILANNDTMIQQTDELIQHAIKTERNTRYAALYAEVAAVNLETATFTNTDSRDYDKSNQVIERFLSVTSPEIPFNSITIAYIY